MQSQTLTLRVQDNNGPVRIIWPDLFTARKVDPNNEKEEPMYSVTVMIPKESAEGKAAIAALRQAITSIWTAQWPGDKVRGDKQPMRDGDAKDSATDEYIMNETYRGYITLRAKSKRPPTVVDKDMRQLDERAGYPAGGDWCNVTLGLFTYDGKFGKGVSCGIDAVQFVRSGDPLGGRRAVLATDVFAAMDLSNDAPAAGDDSTPF